VFILGFYVINGLDIRIPARINDACKFKCQFNVYLFCEINMAKELPHAIRLTESSGFTRRMSHLKLKLKEFYRKNVESVHTLYLVLKFG